MAGFLLRNSNYDKLTRFSKCNMHSGKSARLITPDEALRILEAMDQECRHLEPPLGAAAEDPSAGGQCFAARASAKVSPVRETSGGVAARPRPARSGPGDAVLVERRSQQTPLAERLERRTMGKMQSATVCTLWRPTQPPSQGPWRRFRCSVEDAAIALMKTYKMGKMTT